MTRAPEHDREQRRPEPHGPGGMDAIDEDPVPGLDDEAPGGMTGIPDGDEKER